MNTLAAKRLRTMFRWVAHPAGVEERNVRNVLIDGVGVGLVGGVATFLSVFLVRLGASPFLVGLLTAMPALTGMLMAIPVGQYLQRQRNIVPWYSRSRVMVFFSYLLTGLVPFFFGPDQASIAIIAIWAMATLPQTVVNVAFTIVMGAVAGPDRRYYLMSRRWSILGISSALSVALVGGWLDQGSFPLNYQLAFIISFAGGLLSFAFSSRISIPDNEQEEQSGPPLSLAGRLREGLAALRENPEYSRFVLSQFVLRFGITLALPLFPLFWVRELEASNTWIGIINTVQSAVLLVAYFFWASMSRRKGAVTVLRICGIGMAFYPLLTGLTGSVPPLALYAALAGFFNAGLDLVLFDTLLSTCPPRHSATYIALYQFTTHVATLAAPILGTVLAEAYGYPAALFVSSGLRFAGMALFILLGVGVTGAEARPAEIKQPLKANKS